MKSSTFKLVKNLYPPYWATGISVKTVSRDYRFVRVEMKKRWYNQNYVKTHFGGSLYAMVDPFFMLMLIPILGKEYVVWDQAASIDFIKPGMGTVSAEFLITDAMIKDILEKTSQGEKYLPQYPVEILDNDGGVVAMVTKKLYIRKKRAS